MSGRFFVIAPTENGVSDVYRLVPVMSFADTVAKIRGADWFVVQTERDKPLVESEYARARVLLLPDDVVAYWSSLSRLPQGAIMTLVNEWAAEFRRAEEQRRQEEKKSDIAFGAEWISRRPKKEEKRPKLRLVSSSEEEGEEAEEEKVVQKEKEGGKKEEEKKETRLVLRLVLSEEEEEEEEEPVCRPLSVEEEKRVKAAFQTDGNTILGVFNQGQVLYRNLRTLRPHVWLDDEVVNAKLFLLGEECKKAGNCVRFHIFSTFFYELLSGSKLTDKEKAEKPTAWGYARVRGWTKSFDAFALDKVIVPVHLGAHWALIAIDLRKKRIEYYDSLCDEHDVDIYNARMKHLAKWLRNLWNDRHPNEPPLNISDWAYRVPRNLPLQTNGSDCGVFTIQYARYVIRKQGKEVSDVVFPFTQADIPCLRKRIALDLLDAAGK